MNNETMDWKQAAKAWGEGKLVEIWDSWEGGYRWMDLSIAADAVRFEEGFNYRLKPQAEEKATAAETVKDSIKPIPVKCWAVYPPEGDFPLILRQSERDAQDYIEGYENHELFRLVEIEIQPTKIIVPKEMNASTT